MTPQCVLQNFVRGGGETKPVSRGKFKLVRGGAKQNWFKERATLVSRGRSKTG